MSVFQPVFDQLKQILKPYEAFLYLVHDEPAHYYLDIPAKDEAKKREFFAMVSIKKSYVSVHLIALYFFPELLEQANVSEALKKQMQGKACFNFKKIDLSLFAEFEQLVLVCFEHYQKLGKI